MSSSIPKITICIPHWQVGKYMTVCLRSLRKHSRQYDLDVIVIDNGSKDNSLDYLRSLDWLRLIERPEEVHTNWPLNVFSAWDCGLQEARGDYYITMHSDVFIKRDDWLDPFLREINRSPSIAASGAWKLFLENPLYALQKRVIGYGLGKIKSTFGKKRNVRWKQGHYPRDYCAMYRRSVLLDHDLSFRPLKGIGGGGHSIAKRIWDAGYKMGMFSIHEMDQKLFHVAHGTAAVAKEKPLNHRRAQNNVERRVDDLFQQDWIKALLADDSLDATRAAA